MRTGVTYVQMQFAIDSPETADAIVEQLLTQGLVACGQRIGPMVSRYWWDGSLERAQEWLVLLKTRQELTARVTDVVVRLHPYETPEVITVAIAGGSPAYLAWMGDVTTSGGAEPRQW